MQPWLSLFIQCAVPVFKTLATVNNNATLSRLPSTLADNLTQTQQMLDFLGMVDPADDAEDALPDLSDFGQSAAVQAFVQTVRWALQQRHLDFQQWRWQQEKALQQTLATQQREVLLKLAAEQRRTALQLPEVHKILDHWPLRLFPSQLLDGHGSEGLLPLRIFMVPPTVQFEPRLESSIDADIPDLELSLAQRLRDFLNQSYGLHNSSRPTEFLGGAWESKRFHGEASIKALFNLLRSEPTLILESEIDGDILNFRMAYWGLGQTRYSYCSLFQLPYRNFLEASARARALRWQVVREKLVALGRSPETIAKLGGDNEANLALLQEANTLEAAGIDLRELHLQYQLNRQDWDSLVQLLATCHCLIAGWIADIHHWRYHAAAPMLPTHLPQLTQAIDNADLTRQLLEKTIVLYGDVLPASSIENGVGWAPELSLKLAYSLAHLPDQSFARNYINSSLQSWLVQRQRLPQQEPQTLTMTLEAMQSVLIPDDRLYFETLADCFTMLGDNQAIQQVRSLLERIATLATNQNRPKLTLCHSTQLSPAKVLAVDLKTQNCQVFASHNSHQIQAWQWPKVMDVAQDVEKCPPRLLKGHRGKVLTLAMSADGQTMVSSERTHDRSCIRIWDLATGKLQRTLPGHRQPIHALVLSADSQLLASGSHKIKLWRFGTGDAFRTLFGHRHRVDALAITPNAQTVISGSEDATVKIWDVRTGELQRTLKGHQGGIRSLAVSPDGQWVVSGSEDHTLRLWDLRSGKVSLTLKAHQGAVDALLISPDGQHLISGSTDATLNIWDIQTGELLQTLVGHSASIRALAICPSGKTLASGSEDGSLKLWQVS